MVAVGAQPLLWAVQCDICDDLVTEGTPDGYFADMQEQDHINFHLLDFIVEDNNGL